MFFCTVVTLFILSYCNLERDSVNKRHLAAFPFCEIEPSRFGYTHTKKMLFPEQIKSGGIIEQTGENDVLNFGRNYATLIFTRQIPGDDTAFS